MSVITILARRLGVGKTCEDFRKAWYHAVGFGVPCKLCSAINAFDQREVIVALGEIGPGQDPPEDTPQRRQPKAGASSDAIIGPEIGRTFGVVVSEDDFPPAGEVEPDPPRSTRRRPTFGKSPKDWRWPASSSSKLPPRKKGVREAKAKRPRGN